MEYQSTDIFIFINHSHDTRRSYNNLICPQARTTLLKNSILCAGPNLWNSIPEQLKSLTNLTAFKNQVKKYIFSIQ